MFKFITKFFKNTQVSQCEKTTVMRLCLNPEDMNEWQKTDVVLAWNMPFMTLTESKLPNVWYHEHFDWLCKYTSEGFKQEKIAFSGSKKILFERGFGRHIA